MTDMLKLLKIVDKVEKPVMINEAVSLNISANGDCPDDITSILGKLVNLSNPQPVTDKMMPQGDNHDVMMKTISNVGDYANQAAHDYADEVGEEYANEPKPKIAPVSSVTTNAGGGMNGPKKQYRKEYPGDNPMAVAEGRAAQLMVEYKKMLEATDSKNEPKSKVVHCSQCGKGFSGGGLKAPHHTGFSHCKDHKGMKVIAEATDRLNELSPKTMGSYINKSVTDLAVNARMAAGKPGSSEENKTAIKRVAGIKRAADKLTREDVHAARAAQDKVKDLEQQAYDAERMGDEKTMRRRFADAALQKLKNKEAHQASVKKVNELSPATLASYAKKASGSSHPNSAPNLASRAGYELGQSPDDDYTAGEKHDKKSATRSKFIGKAIDRLSR